MTTPRLPNSDHVMQVPRYRCECFGEIADDDKITLNAALAALEEGK